MMAKYFATSLAIENVVSAPRVINSCLPISTTSINLVGLESRSTMLPASRAACVPVFMATPTSACARAGASLVPSPHIATRLPLACSSRMTCNLSSRVDCALQSRRCTSVDAAHAVLRRERNEGGGKLRHVAAADAVFFLRQHDDRTALGRLIRQRCQLRRVRKLHVGHAADRAKRRRLPVAERDGAGLVE